MDKIASGGTLKSPTVQRVFWACMEGLLAATLLLIGGDRAIEVLRTAVTSIGLPLAITLVLLTFSLIKGIEEAHKKQVWAKDARRFEKFLEKSGADEDQR